MNVPKPSVRGRFALPALTAALLLGPAASHAMAAAAAGAVFTQTNDPAGNVVQRFLRAADGTLTPAGSFPTGGVGLAGLGGRQGAVELSDDGRYVYAVNPGSDSLTAFRNSATALQVVDTVSSGGSAPVSVDRRGSRVYVLNSGGTPSVTGFTVRADGTLKPIHGGRRELPGAMGAAQVSIAPGGRALLVSERLSNRLETLPLDRLGRPGAPVVTASSGPVPFGFAFSRRGVAVVSEAGNSSVSSYRFGQAGPPVSVTASLPVGQGAACWVAVSPDGMLAYTGNAAGGISGFRIAPDASLRAVGTTLVASPRDLDFSRDGRFLYAVSPGVAGGPGQVTGFRVAADGSLTLVDAVPAAPGLTGAAAA